MHSVTAVMNLAIFHMAAPARFFHEEHHATKTDLIQGIDIPTPRGTDHTPSTMVIDMGDMSTNHNPTAYPTMTGAAASEGKHHTLHSSTTASHSTLWLMDALIAILDEVSNKDTIYESYKPTIDTAVQLLKTELELKNMSPPKSPQSKRSLLPFLGYAIKWLTGTATMRDTQEIKQCVNQLIQDLTKQQKSLVHVISILNVTRYTAQVSKQKLNEMIDALQKSNEDLNRLFNTSEVLTQCIRYQQMYIYMCTLLANPRGSLIYIRQVAIHSMDYVDAAMADILSPNIFPVEDLKSMLRNIEPELPSTMHLPISSDDILHFYQDLNTHVLIAEGYLLLLIDVPNTNGAQQLQIYEFFNLPVLHSNPSNQYKFNNRYIGVTYDKIKGVDIMDQQHIACQDANGQFCRINAPIEPLTKPPSCITVLYTENDQEIRK